MSSTHASTKTPRNRSFCHRLTAHFSTSVLALDNAKLGRAAAAKLRNAPVDIPHRNSRDAFANRLAQYARTCTRNN